MMTRGVWIAGRGGVQGGARRCPGLPGAARARRPQTRPGLDGGLTRFPGQRALKAGDKGGKDCMREGSYYRAGSCKSPGFRMPFLLVSMCMIGLSVPPFLQIQSALAADFAKCPRDLVRRTNQTPSSLTLALSHHLVLASCSSSTTTTTAAGSSASPPCSSSRPAPAPGPPAACATRCCASCWGRQGTRRASRTGRAGAGARRRAASSRWGARRGSTVACICGGRVKCECGACGGRVGLGAWAGSAESFLLARVLTFSDWVTF